MESDWSKHFVFQSDDGYSRYVTSLTSLIKDFERETVTNFVTLKQSKQFGSRPCEFLFYILYFISPSMFSQEHCDDNTLAWPVLAI
mgnify:CR=1 FL=1